MRRNPPFRGRADGGFRRVNCQLGWALAVLALESSYFNPRQAILALPPAGRFATTEAVLPGRILDAARGPVLDVRARIGDRVFMAVLYPAPTATDLAFELQLRGLSGHQELCLEGFIPAQGWVTWTSTAVEFPATIALAPAGPPPPGGQVLRLLRAQHRAPGIRWETHVRDTIDSARAELAVINPLRPLWGNLESTIGPAIVDHWHLALWGWLLHETRPIVRVEAWVHPWLRTNLPRGTRPDVDEHFKRFKGVGFEGQVAVPASQPQPWNLVISVEYEGGERETAFARRRWGPALAAELHGELPPFTRDGFLLAARALHPRTGPKRRQVAGLWEARKLYRENDAVARSPVHYWRPSHRGTPMRNLRVVVVNDNLILGGAAWFAYEYARFLRSHLGWQVRLAAPSDGPLRPICEQSGLPVALVDLSALDAARDEMEFHDAAKGLARVVGWEDVDLVVANTLVASWAVPVAAELGIPSLLYFHEGARLRWLFGPAAGPAWPRAAARALGAATRTVFLTEWTRKLHAAHERQGNFRLLRSWVDLARLDRIADENDPVVLRRRHRIPADAFVFVSLGSICDRKGQRLLLRALQWWRQVAGAEFSSVVVLLVGARPTPDVARLRAESVELGLEGVRIIEETPAAIEYVHLANAYVCASYEEGLPRSLMEAAALRKAIVTTAIQGIPEMLSENEAWLVPPGEPAALAGAMQQAMAAIRAGDCRRPLAARRRMEMVLDAKAVLPEHAALAMEAAATRRGLREVSA